MPEQVSKFCGVKHEASVSIVQSIIIQSNVLLHSTSRWAMKYPPLNNRQNAQLTPLLILNVSGAVKSQAYHYSESLRQIQSLMLQDVVGTLLRRRILAVQIVIRRPH